jgi:quercetin dioxygenase-like cupin family protein
MRSPVIACVLLAVGLTCKDDGKGPRKSAPLTRERMPETRHPRMGAADAELAGPVLMDIPSVRWMQGPPALPKGALMAVLEGEPPFAAGKTFSMLLKLPAGYTIPPHTHPTTERVTVLQGRIRFGHGTTSNEEAATVVEPAGLVLIPPGHTHYAFTTDEEAVLALHGIGPWDIYYVDPTKDPRQPPPEKPRITKSEIETDTPPKIIAATDVQFVDPPAGLFPDGARIAILEGDPANPKTFIMRVKLPDGYRLPVHAVGITDRFDVLQGEPEFAIGERRDHQALRSFGPGSVILVPKGVQSYASAHGETVIQIFGVGPYEVTYRDPNHVPHAAN